MRDENMLGVEGGREGLTCLYRVEVVSVPDWYHHQAGGDPGHRYGDLGIGDCSVTQGGHRVDHGQVPVPRHEDQGVDGDVGRDVDDVLDRPAPGQTEGPEHEDVVTGRGRDTDQDEQEVRHGQVEDQQVGRVLHLGVPVDLGPGHSYRITLRATRETDRQREKYEMI